MCHPPKIMGFTHLDLSNTPLKSKPALKITPDGRQTLVPHT